jgi:hypothetical protein
MIKQIQSNRMKIDSEGNVYLEDQYGNVHYEICKSDPPSKTRVNVRIDKTYWLIIIAVISSMLSTIYYLLSR